MIVSPEPARGIFLNVFDFRKEIVTQPIVSYCSIISFDVSILLRVARLDEQQIDTMFLSPRGQQSTDILRPVITADLSWLPPPLNHLIQCAFNADSGQREVDFDYESFAIKVVNDVE
jgi:hypothetical protein